MTETGRLRNYWRWGIWGVFLFALLLLLALRLAAVAAWPALDSPLGPFNPDAWLRLAQLRDWLGGNEFFGHTVARTNAPAGDIAIHWTRPLDFILAGLYALTPSGMDVTRRLLVAASLYPIVLCLFAATLLAAAARKIFNHNHVIACTLLLLGASPYLSAYFSPGDADHHGLLSVLWCGVLVLLLDLSRPVLKVISIGALLGMMIWISPEGLILYSLVMAVLAVETLRLHAPARPFSLFHAASGAAAVATVGLFIEVPVDQIFAEVAYDSLSIVYVFLLWLLAASALFFSLLCGRWRNIFVRLAGAGAIGLITLLAMHRAYPRFFLGPFADADPYIFENFLPFISEARPLLSFPFAKYVPSLLQPLVGLFLAFVAFLHSRKGSVRRRKVALISTLLIVMLGLTLLQLRWAYYLAPLALILCAGLLPTLSVAARRFSFAPRRWQPYLWLVFIFAYIAGTAMAGAKLAKERPGVACMNEIRFVIQTQQLQPLIKPADRIFYTYEDVGGEMLFFTPYRIIASNYHREAEGLRDLKAMREAPDLESFHALLRKRNVGALLVCPLYHPALFEPGIPLPEWLEKIGGLEFYQPAGNKPELYRVLN